MIEPAEFDEKVTPYFTLAGKRWPLPHLAPRQLRTARRMILDLNERIVVKVVEPSAKNSGDGEEAEIEERGDNDGNSDGDEEKEEGGGPFVNMSDEDYDTMLEVIFLALTRAHPKMTRDQVYDMPIDDIELFMAFIVIRKQSGLFTQIGAFSPGEAMGETATRNGTGI